MSTHTWPLPHAQSDPSVHPLAGQLRLLELLEAASHTDMQRVTRHRQSCSTHGYAALFQARGAYVCDDLLPLLLLLLVQMHVWQMLQKELADIDAAGPHSTNTPQTGADGDGYDDSELDGDPDDF
jgi:hypothetical protein